MSNFKIEWKGDTELAEVFRRAIEQTPKQVSDALYNAAESIQNGAKGYAPVDTGHLKESIVTRHGEMSAEIESGAAYAGFQEFGTRYQEGTAHLGPAVRDEIPKFEKIIRDVAEGLFK